MALKLLYVEDNRADVDQVTRALSQPGSGVQWVLADSLAQARRQLADPGPFDVVLIDLHLPDGHGLDLVRELREQALPLALVVLTGQGDQDLAVAALKAGANDYLVKSPAFADRLPGALKAAVQRVADQRSRQQRGLRVLYAEHHAADADLTCRHLARHAPHIRVQLVADSLSLLRRLPGQPGQPWDHDVLLLDYRLYPDSGLDVLKRLRDEVGHDLPVVVVTGQGSEDIAAKTLRLGATDYLVKHANYLIGLPQTLESAFHRVAADRERALLRESEARLRGLNAELESRVQLRTAELELARDQAQQANRAKTGFLSNMSHELRTPMNAVLGFSHLLVTETQEPLSPRLKGYAQNIARAGEHLMGLINELLDLARIEAGKLQVQCQPVDLPSTLADALQMVALDAADQGVHLMPLAVPLVVPNDTAAPWRVLADRRRLVQVVVNLLSNAIKYNRRGGQVCLSLEADGDHVRIVVQDNGIGLSPAQQARLFQPFERLGAEQSAIQGSGIGLALSQRFADMMGGALGVHSAPDEGSRFWLRLPRPAPHQTEE